MIVPLRQYTLTLTDALAKTGEQAHFTGPFYVYEGTPPHFVSQLVAVDDRGAQYVRMVCKTMIFLF